MGALLFLKRRNFYYGINRYLLALLMIPYAVTKILRTQFVLLPVGIPKVPLEQVESTVLAWAFLGYSHWFQIMLGFLELIPCVLLVFRRTALAGTLLLLPMTLNVFLINQALDLWKGTQIISAVLLILNLSLLAFEWNRIKAILQIVFTPLIRGSIKWEVITNIAILATVIFLSSIPLINYLNETNELTGDWHNQQPYEWRLVEAYNGDSLVPTIDKSIFFGAYGGYGEYNSSQILLNDKKYFLNKEEGVLELKPINESPPISYRYVLEKDSILTLVTSNNDRELKEIYHRKIMKLGKKAY